MGAGNMVLSSEHLCIVCALSVFFLFRVPIQLLTSDDEAVRS